MKITQEHQNRIETFVGRCNLKPDGTTWGDHYYEVGKVLYPDKTASAIKKIASDPRTNKKEHIINFINYVTQ